MATQKLNERILEVRWSSGSCGNPGCSNPACVCALCAQPIGTPEEQLEDNDHDPDCAGCAMCEDQVPMILFQGEGKQMKQAAFHKCCFEKLLVA